MADIAMVFHWPPEAMNTMPLEELAGWREKARQRFEQQNQTETPTQR